MSLHTHYEDGTWWVVDDAITFLIGFNTEEEAEDYITVMEAVSGKEDNHKQ